MVMELVGDPAVIRPYRLPADHPAPEPGWFVLSTGGSLYLIEKVRELPARGGERRYHLDVRREGRTDPPDDAVVLTLIWDRRDRRRSR